MCTEGGLLAKNQVANLSIPKLIGVISWLFSDLLNHAGHSKRTYTNLCPRKHVLSHPLPGNAEAPPFHHPIHGRLATCLQSATTFYCAPSRHGSLSAIDSRRLHLAREASPDPQRWIQPYGLPITQPGSRSFIIQAVFIPEYPPSHRSSATIKFTHPRPPLYT